MKNAANLYTSNGNHMPKQACDKILKETLQAKLPQAPTDEWFTRKVMNRLPEKKPTSPVSVPEKICYGLGVILLLAAWIYSIIFTRTNGITSTTLAMAAILPMVTFFCIGIFVIPAIRRAV